MLGEILTSGNRCLLASLRSQSFNFFPICSITLSSSTPTGAPPVASSIVITSSAASRLAFCHPKSLANSISSLSSLSSASLSAAVGLAGLRELSHWRMPCTVLHCVGVPWVWNSSTARSPLCSSSLSCPMTAAAEGPRTSQARSGVQRASVEGGGGMGGGGMCRAVHLGSGQLEAAVSNPLCQQHLPTSACALASVGGGDLPPSAVAGCNFQKKKKCSRQGGGGCVCVL